MRKIIPIVHLSLDGFVANAEGELDWFDNANAHLPLVNEIISSADAALFGRSSYQLLHTYWPQVSQDVNATEPEKVYSNWYNAAEKMVLTNTLQEPVPDKTRYIKGDIEKELAAIKQEPGKDIIIFGSPSVCQQLAKANLIDEYWLFINPVSFGKGVPLFTPLMQKTTFKLLEYRIAPNEEVALRYGVV